MIFWKWFFRGILHLPRAIISPIGEYVMAIILGSVSVLIVGIAVSPWWLLLVVPAFCLMAAHGYWRSWVKNK